MLDLRGNSAKYFFFSAVFFFVCVFSFTDTADSKAWFGATHSSFDIKI